MKTLDIKLTYRCNNDCTYCCQDRQLRKKTSDLTTEEVNEILEVEVAKGLKIDKVVLTGGEPTINKDLLEIVKLIKLYGVRIIQLQTNAKSLNNMDTCRKLVDSGVNSFGISLHGATDTIHELFTNTPHSFEQTVQSLKNLKKIKECKVSLNTVVTNFNIDKLGDIIKYVQDEGLADSLQLAFIHLTGKAEACKNEIIKITDAANAIKHAISTYGDGTIKIFTEAIPFCLMSGYEKNVAEAYNSGEVLVYDKFKNREFTKLRKTMFKGKGPSCWKCIFSNMCEGPWIEYPELLGFDEFIPVRDFGTKK